MHGEVVETIMETEERGKKTLGADGRGADRTAALQVLVRGAGKVGCR